MIHARDRNSFTTISYACYKNNEECFMLLFDHALKQNLKNLGSFVDKMSIITEWLNAPNNEDSTSIHFAAYHGNIQLIEFLIQKGVDYKKKNKFGSDVMHLAAKGDQPLPLWYFHKVRNLDINVRDKKESTPLHWAAYSKSEISLTYLLSWDVAINAQD